MKNIVISFKNEKFSDKTKVELTLESYKILKRYIKEVEYNKSKNIKVKWTTKTSAEVYTSPSDLMHYYK